MDHLINQNEVLLVWTNHKEVGFGNLANPFIGTMSHCTDNEGQPMTVEQVAAWCEGYDNFTAFRVLDPASGILRDVDEEMAVALNQHDPDWRLTEAFLEYHAVLGEAA